MNGNIYQLDSSCFTSLLSKLINQNVKDNLRIHGISLQIRKRQKSSDFHPACVQKKGTMEINDFASNPHQYHVTQYDRNVLYTSCLYHQSIRHRRIPGLGPFRPTCAVIM